MKKRNILISVLVVLIACVLGLLLYASTLGEEGLAGIFNFNQDDKRFTPISETFEDKKAKNPDYIAELSFDSGLFEFPVVQGSSNGTYLQTDWETMEYDIEGSIFMDYRNEINDQNLIIYGHYVYADENAKFGPLHILKDQANYEANKDITLELEHEWRFYEIAKVFYCQLVQDENGEYVYTVDNLQYHQAEFDDDYFDVYMNAIDEVEFYDTGIDLTTEDKLLTLQTCVRNRDDLRLIIVAKQVARYDK